VSHAYYNEFDPYAAQWLRNLIARGLIAPGDVDERSIAAVRPDDIRGYAQCHFFAGIGGWSLALRLAGWPDDRPVWTGSCPCQPFSAAGKGKAADDERHLWPVWFPLVRELAPPVLFGEQVEAAIGWGWLDAVFSDLEAEGYACGASVLPACGVGAPHIRQRTWFVADAGSVDGWPTPWERLRDDLGAGGELDRLGNPDDAGSQGHRESGERAGQCASRQTGGLGGSPWDDLQWLPCTDGKARPVKPGIFPLAHGVSGRVGKLSAAGNAIVPALAAEFIAAYLDITR